MSRASALDGLPPHCPQRLVDRQQLVTVTYWSFDGRLHQGQLLLGRDLVPDIQEIFALARDLRFPIQSVIPIAHPLFRKDGRWDDDLSMAANNTSAFNYRLIAGTNRLSNHALGRAVDLNPLQNPYVKGPVTLPPGATYNPRAPGTLTDDHPIVQRFISLGWKWGGHWQSLKDYQHFEKPSD